MYEVTVQTTIASAHHLRGYEGKCENVHGHNYRVEATVHAAGLDRLGLAIDFKQLQRLLGEAAGCFDHRDLNQCQEFAEENPSSENLARVIFNRLRAEVEGLPVRLVKVRVWESGGSSVAYWQD